MNVKTSIPSYSLLCKRQKDLNITFSNIDSSTKMIESFELTDAGTQDCQAFPRLINKIKDKEIVSCIGDGAYDRFSVYEKAKECGFNLITPPQCNSKTSVDRPRNKYKASKDAVNARDEIIKEVRKIGLKEWKIKTGYHKRSLVENCMYRFKNLAGSKLISRKNCNQFAEVSIKCEILNKMLSLGLN